MQEQPLLLEDLLEQEKREQERQAVSTINNEMTNNMHPNASGLLSDQDFERLRADVIGAGPQGIPAQGLLPLQQSTDGSQIQQPVNMPFVPQNAGIRQQFIQRGMNQQWKGNMNMKMHMEQPQLQPQPQQHLMKPNTTVMNSTANVPMEHSIVKKEG